MDSDEQFWTIQALVASLTWEWRERTDYYVGSNLSIYYVVETVKHGRRYRKHVFRGPDFFVVLNPQFRKPRRNSWVVDNECGKFPDVIVEVLSSSTKKNDVGVKKDIYERNFQTPEYFLVDPGKEIVFGYRLTKGRYVPITPTIEGLLWSERFGLFLGMYQNPGDELKPEEPRYGRLARFFTPDKKPIKLPPEEAVKQMARAQREAERAQREAERAQREAERAQRQAERAQSETERAQREAERAQHAEERAQSEAERAQSEAERAQRQAERAQLAEERAQLAEQEMDKLLEKLRKLGVNVDEST